MTKKQLVEEARRMEQSYLAEIERLNAEIDRLRAPLAVRFGT